jgi:hypothetical protein
LKLNVQGPLFKASCLQHHFIQCVSVRQYQGWAIIPADTPRGSYNVTVYMSKLDQQQRLFNVKNDEEAYVWTAGTVS